MKYITTFLTLIASCAVFASPIFPKEAVILTDVASAPKKVFLPDIDTSILTCKPSEEFANVNSFDIPTKYIVKIGSEKYEIFEGEYSFDERNRPCFEVSSTTRMVLYARHSILRGALIYIQFSFDENKFYIGEIKSQEFLKLGPKLGRGEVTARY